MDVDNLLSAALAGARSTGLHVYPDSEEASYIGLKLAQAIAGGLFDRPSAARNPRGTAHQVGRYAAGNFFRLGGGDPAYRRRIKARKRMAAGTPKSYDRAWSEGPRTLDDATTPPGREPSPQEAAIAAEDRGRIRDAMRHLSWEERYVVESYYGLHGRPQLTMREIAARLGKPNAYAKGLRDRGEAILRAALGEGAAA